MAWWMIEWTRRTTGPSSSLASSSSAPSRTSSGEPKSSSSSTMSIGSPPPATRWISSSMSSGAAIDRAHAAAGDQRDVVHPDDVRRLGERDEQVLVVAEADRDGLVAAHDLRGDERGGAQVDLEGRQVDVVEALPLGDDAGELVGGEHAALQQHAPGRAAGGARDVDRRVDHLARGEAEVDDDVADQARGEAALRGRGEAALRRRWARLQTSIVTLAWIGRRARSLTPSPRPSSARLPWG